MIYFNASAPESANFSKNILLEDCDIEKRAAYQAFDVFLSHSSNDKIAIPQVIGFLKKFNINVYIDKRDTDLPTKTSPKTGEKLKTRIHECRKFIVYVTPKSKDSRWIPWELGIADGKKRISNIALLPDLQNQPNTQWPEQEYLGLYPRITFGMLEGYPNPVWMVLDHHSNTATELGKWLKPTVI